MENNFSGSTLTKSYCEMHFGWLESFFLSLTLGLFWCLLAISMESIWYDDTASSSLCLRSAWPQLTRTRPLTGPVVNIGTEGICHHPLLANALTRLTWLIHTSVLPSIWNLGKNFALIVYLGQVQWLKKYFWFSSMREDGCFCYWICDFPQN